MIIVLHAKNNYLDIGKPIEMLVGTISDQYSLEYLFNILFLIRENLIKFKNIILIILPWPILNIRCVCVVRKPASVRKLCYRWIFCYCTISRFFLASAKFPGNFQDYARVVEDFIPQPRILYPCRSWNTFLSWRKKESSMGYEEIFRYQQMCVSQDQ